MDISLHSINTEASFRPLDLEQSRSRCADLKEPTAVGLSAFCRSEQDGTKLTGFLKCSGISIGTRCGSMVNRGWCSVGGMNRKRTRSLLLVLSLENFGSGESDNRQTGRSLRGAHPVTNSVQHKHEIYFTTDCHYYEYCHGMLQAIAGEGEPPRIDEEPDPFERDRSSCTDLSLAACVLNRSPRPRSPRSLELVREPGPAGPFQLTPLAPVRICSSPGSRADA